MRSIVVGYDATESSERALARATELAEALHAQLIVLSVGVPLPTLAGGAAGPVVVPVGDDDALAEARRHLEAARARLEPRGLQAEYVADVGFPSERIVALAEERKASLVVVGTREPGFLKRLLEGSVSQDVSRRAHCDVLIVH